MKRFFLLIALALAVAQPARAEVSVSLNFFVDALEPHGSWIDVDGYGYCWRPRVAVEDPDWRPYTRGHWAYTEGGWTWISDEDWGWATYHYGRWTRINARWCWVPGYEWAPAWVSWRENDDALGWAPLPPEARWDARIGFSSWTDGYYDVGPDYYSFVPRRYFGARSLRGYYLDRERNSANFERSVNITRIVHQGDIVNNIFVGGPQIERVDRDGGNRIHRLRMRQDTSDFQREWREDDPRGGSQRYRALSRIDGDELIVAAPKVDPEAKAAPPPRVAGRFGNDSIDRGWRGVSSAEQDRLRRSLHASAEKSRPRELPVRPERPRIGWAVPSPPPAVQPAEEVGTPVPPRRPVEDDPRRGTTNGGTPRPPRGDPRREIPAPGAVPQPAESPAKHIAPPRSGRKRDEGSVDAIPQAPPQSKKPPEQPKSTREQVAPSARTRESGAPERNAAPQSPPPRTVESPQRKNKGPRPGPSAAAPAAPSPKANAPRSSPKVRDAQDAGDAGKVRSKQVQAGARPQQPPPAQAAGDAGKVRSKQVQAGPRPQQPPPAQAAGDAGKVRSKQVQAGPRPQQQPPAQPKGTPTGPSPKKAPTVPEEEEKKGKRKKT